MESDVITLQDIFLAKPPDEDSSQAPATRGLLGTARLQRAEAALPGEDGRERRDLAGRLLRARDGSRPPGVRNGQLRRRSADAPTDPASRSLADSSLPGARFGGRGDPRRSTRPPIRTSGSRSSPSPTVRASEAHRERADGRGARGREPRAGRRASSSRSTARVSMTRPAARGRGRRGTRVRRGEARRRPDRGRDVRDRPGPPDGLHDGHDRRRHGARLSRSTRSRARRSTTRSSWRLARWRASRFRRA